MGYEFSVYYAHHQAGGGDLKVNTATTGRARSKSPATVMQILQAKHPEHVIEIRDLRWTDD